MNDSLTTDAVDAAAETTEKPALPMWKKVLLGIALALGIIGLILYLLSPAPAEPPPPPPASADFSAQGLGQNFIPLPGDAALANLGEQGEQLIEAITMADWSSLLMKLGFSFMIGFAIAYAVSGILKMTLLVVGLIALLLFGLQYAGLIDVNWHNFEPYYDSFIAWLQPQIGSFRDFITSNLPSSTMAAAGLVVGFRQF